MDIPLFRVTVGMLIRAQGNDGSLHIYIYILADEAQLYSTPSFPRANIPTVVWIKLIESTLVYGRLPNESITFIGLSNV